MANANLNRAKKAKNDEFYTRYEDIELEVEHYKDYLKGKSVLCNCNDSLDSNFYRYFNDNFERLELKRLVCTSYGDHAYKVERAGDTTAVTPLKGDGDFESPECIELLRQADVVISNPPFSKALDFLALLEKYHKDYLFIGNLNMASCVEPFNLILEDKLRLGYRPLNRGFEFEDVS